MKAYGIPRNQDVEWPDCGDMKYYGMKSSIGRYAKKSGDYAGPTGEQKNKYRRMWKKMERLATKRTISKELDE